MGHAFLCFLRSWTVRNLVDVLSVFLLLSSPLTFKFANILVFKHDVYISKDEVKKKNWDCQLCICNCTDPRCYTYLHLNLLFLGTIGM